MVEGAKPNLPEGLNTVATAVLRPSKRRLVAVFSCLVLAGLGIMFLARSTVTQDIPAPAAVQQSPQEHDDVSDAEALAEELASILSQVEGAGRVEVRLTVSMSGAEQWEKNTRQNRSTIEERDENGGVRITTEETDQTDLALIRGADGGESPVETTNSPPKIAGALIVAEGAGNPEIQSTLARAASVFLGLDLHKVMVLPKEDGR